MKSTPKMKILEMLRLKEPGLSQRQIAGYARSTVGDVLARCVTKGLDYEAARTLTDAPLQKLLYPAGLGYSQFCEKYRRYRKASGKNVSLHQERKAGDTLDCVVESATGNRCRRLS